MGLTLGQDAASGVSVHDRADSPDDWSAIMNNAADRVHSARHYLKHLALRLERHARSNDYDGPRFAVIDSWASRRLDDIVDRAEGAPDDAYVLKWATLDEVWAWLEQHEPQHGRITRDAEEAWRESIGLPTLESLGFDYYSDLQPDAAEEAAS
jgi:hypothetical protein